MLLRSFSITQPEGLELTSPEARSAWMRATPQLDITSNKVQTLASQLTRRLKTDRDKALAVHSEVKSLPFACVPDFLHTKASDVLRIGCGDCHTKGLLFVALLRASSVPARLRFVTLSTRFLNGVIDTGVNTMTHAVAEVYLDTRWVQTDTYVVDDALGQSARELLAAKHMQLGFGVHALGEQTWDAQSDSHAQYTKADPSSMPVVDWGVAHDPAHFYANESHAALRQSFMVRVKWMLGAQVVNRKVEQIRLRGKHFSASALPHTV